MPLLPPPEKKIALIALGFGVLMLLAGVAVGSWVAIPERVAEIAPPVVTQTSPVASAPAVPAPTPLPAVVAPPPTPSPASEVQPLIAGYAVVAGVYASPILAETRRRELIALGHPATVALDPLSKGQRMGYLVVTHTFPDYASALDAALRLQAASGVRATVRAVGKD